LAQDALSFLRPGLWISGEEIAVRLGVSRAAVCKQVRALRASGYRIDSSPRRGYRLLEADLLDPERIASGLQTRFLGRELRCFQEVESTNDVARSLAESCPDGTVVLAEVQTKGRGRLARSWASPPGGIWMSVVLKPALPLSQAYRVNMAVSLAVTRALSRQYQLEGKIKWPNDILVRGRKISGILMEVRAELDRLEYVIAGVGLNVNIDPNRFPREWNVTSVSEELGGEVSRTELVQEILCGMEEAYLHLRSEEILEEWRAASATKGRYVRVRSPDGVLEGKAESLGEDGSLYLRTEKGLQRILAGDCLHLRGREEGEE
jgi:BirA family biotin operon repressor/biotin-[acetyl-CoA-carboxylase] ligase